MTIFIYAVICVSLSVAAQFLLKAGMSSVSIKAALAQPLGIGTILPVFTNSLVISGFALYGLGAVAWLGVLSKWDVSKAYPLVGVGFLFTVAIGWYLGEQVSLSRAAGVVLIALGVILVGRS